MATFDLYVNLRPEIGQPAFVRSATSGAAFQFPKVFREGKMALRIFPLLPNPTGGVAAPFTAADLDSYDCKVAIGSPANGATPAEELCSQANFAWNATDGCFDTGVLNINTVQMNAVLDAASSPEVSKTFEVQIKNGSTEEYTAQATITVRNEVIVDGGGVPTPNTENVFADSMMDILTDSYSVEWRRTANDIYADVRRVNGGGIAESASGLSVDNLLKTPGLFAPLTVQIVGSGSPSFTATPSSHADTSVVGGEAGKRYLCRIEVDFACETTAYLGGVQNLGDPPYFLRGGTDPGYTLNRLTLTDGRRRYQLNYGLDISTVTEAVYYADIIVESGDTLTLEIDSVDGLMNSPLGGTQGATVTLKAALEIPDGFRNFVQNRHALTGLTGGGATKLDGLATGLTEAQEIETGTMVAVVIGDDVSYYQLTNGTDAESSPDVIRPDDYDGTTNARVWLLRSTALPTKLAALNALTWTNNTMPVFTGASTVSAVSTSAFQAADAELAAIAGLTSAANKLPYFTGIGSAALADFTAFGRSLMDDADAAAARTTLGVSAALTAYDENGTVGTAPVASGGLASVAIGNGARATQNYALAFGRSSTASGSESAVLGGINNTASGQYSAAIGGALNTASSIGGLATGGYALADIVSQHARGSGDAGSGFNQSSSIPCSIATTDATPTEILAGGSGRLALRANTAWHFTVKVIARSDSGAGHAAWKVEGAIYRNATAGSTALLGDVEISPNSANAAGWDFTVAADTTNGALHLLATGASATNIMWTAAVELSEVTRS